MIQFERRCAALPSAGLQTEQQRRPPAPDLAQRTTLLRSRAVQNKNIPKHRPKHNGFTTAIPLLSIFFFEPFHCTLRTRSADVIGDPTQQRSTAVDPTPNVLHDIVHRRRGEVSIVVYKLRERSHRFHRQQPDGQIARGVDPEIDPRGR